MTQKLAVVVKGWPRLSETFIAQELVALEEAGHDLDIWSLRHPTDTKTHPLHDRLKAKVRYLPEYLHHDPARVWQARAIAKTLPGYAAAYDIWRRDLARDLDKNRIRRFGQACVLAAELPAENTRSLCTFSSYPGLGCPLCRDHAGPALELSAHAKDIWTSPDWEISEKLSDDSSGAIFGATCTAYGAAQLRRLSADPARIDLVYHGLDLSRFPIHPTTRRAGPMIRCASFQWAGLWRKRALTG